MKKFVWGLVCGVALSSSTAALASGSIQALLFPVEFEINNRAVSMAKEDVGLQVEGRAYVPIRFIADHLGATIDYDAETKTILIKNQKLDITDPSYKTISVGNLIVTKDGSLSKVTGHIQLEGVGNSQNSLEATLSFYNADHHKMGEAVIRGSQFGTEVQTFVAQANGDLRGYAMAALQVKSVNGKKVAEDTGILYENQDYRFALTLPKSWEGKYEVIEMQNGAPEMTYLFLNRANKSHGGVIFSLSVWKREDWQASGPAAMEVGRTKKLGERGEVVFTLSRPGDVQYDLEDEALTAEYAQMSSFVERIMTSFRVVE